MGEQSSYIRGTRVGTYSLLVCDVQLWLGVRLQLILLKSRVDPSILHDLLRRIKQKGRKLKGRAGVLDTEFPSLAEDTHLFHSISLRASDKVLKYR